MGRRKALCTVPLQSGGSYDGWSSTDLCSRDFLQQKYDQALSDPRPTTLYADTTTYHVKRIESLFTEFVPVSCPLNSIFPFCN
jgi:hypothetical protein